MNKKLKYYKILFIVASIFNFLSVIMFLINYKLYFQSYGYNLSYNIVWTTQYLGLIAILGIGYLIIAINPLKNRLIASFGLIGKMYVFTVFLIFTLQNIVAPGVTIATVVDIVFAVLFLEYLINIRKLDQGITSSSSI